MYQQPSRDQIARYVLRRVLRTARRLVRVLLRILFRRPVIDILFLLFVLYLIASLIGRVNRPRPLLYEPPPEFEGR
jgi:hypothetical protein